MVERPPGSILVAILALMVGCASQQAGPPRVLPGEEAVEHTSVEVVTPEDLGKILIEAELIDPGGQAPSCGVVHVIKVMHYRVLRVLEGDFDDRDIYVGHSCINLSPTAFKRGNRYRLSLILAFHPGKIYNFFEAKADSGNTYYCFDMSEM